MVDSCVIRRQTGESTDADGNVTPAYVTIYTGKCRVMSRAVATSSPNSGQQRVDLLTLEVHIPVSVTAADVNDDVEITASRDADLVGKHFRVDNLSHKTDLTARRLPVEERTS